MMIRRAKQVLAGLLAAFLVGIIGFSFVPKAFALTSTQLQQQRDVAARDAARYAQAKKAEQDKQKKLQTQLNQINGDINSTQSKIDATNGQIQDTVATIEVLNSKIAQKQKELEVAQDQQAVALGELYMAPHNDASLLTFSTQTVSDASVRTAYLGALGDKIDETIKTISNLKAELNSQKNDEQERQRQLQELQNKLKAYSDGLASQKQQKDSLLGKSKVAEQDFTQKYDHARKLQQQIESQINALAKASAGKGGIIKAKDQGTSAVGFIWPMDYTKITTEFGTTDSSYPFYPALLFHYGLDIVNPACGTPVTAAADGIANVFSTSQGYGNYVVLGHNAKYSTLYGHLQGFAVVSGQLVKQGQTLGYEGRTGWASGCHLHFEVWENGQRKNPRLFLP